MKKCLMGLALVALVAGCRTPTTIVDTDNDLGPQVASLDYRNVERAASALLQSLFRSGRLDRGDGQMYVMTVGKVKNDIPEDADGAFIQEMAVRPRTNARYVKMVAKTIGICPEGHVGAGQKAWIFCDELVIE